MQSVSTWKKMRKNKRKWIYFVANYASLFFIFIINCKIDLIRTACLKPRININICKRGKRVNLKTEMVVLELIKSDVWEWKLWNWPSISICCCFLTPYALL
jgi:hypothetical protein